MCEVFKVHLKVEVTSSAVVFAFLFGKDDYKDYHLKGQVASLSVSTNMDRD